MSVKQWFGDKLSNMPALIAVIIVVSLVAVACGDGDTVEAESGEGDPPGVASATIVISDGEFDAGKLIVSTTLATQLTLRNEDDVAYTFTIENLVDATDVAASGDTVIDFTSPSEGEFDGSITDPNGEEVDTLTVEVEEREIGT